MRRAPARPPPPRSGPRATPAAAAAAACAPGATAAPSSLRAAIHHGADAGSPRDPVQAYGRTARVCLSSSTPPRAGRCGRQDNPFPSCRGPQRTQQKAECGHHGHRTLVERRAPVAVARLCGRAVLRAAGLLLGVHRAGANDHGLAALRRKVALRELRLRRPGK